MKKVLVAPLDWGLGHATRCIPVVNALLKRSCEVFLAGSGDSLILLQKEFPALTTFQLPGYSPRYPLKGSMALKMIQQLPKFFNVINEEHKAIEIIVEKWQPDLIISDNRYGCWSAQVTSIFITHQSNIIMPKRFGFAGGLVRRLNERQMRNFDRCWVPDHPNHSLAGELKSFDKISGINFQYIGWLSRFRASVDVKKKYDAVAIISGPEPQRTLFEQIILEQLRQSSLRYFVVRGVTSSSNHIAQNNVVDYLTGKDLQDLIEAADVVIARSGYSTIMDLASLNKRAILIPTPGQTEQEYLAQFLKKKQIAYTTSQHQFNLNVALHEVQNYTGFEDYRISNNLLDEALDQVLNASSSKSFYK